MTAKMLVLVEDKDLESTKKSIMKVIDPDGTVESGDTQFKTEKRNNESRLKVAFNDGDVHFMIPMTIFEGLDIRFDHPAAMALLNTITVQGKKYVFLNDEVEELAVQQCRPKT